MFRNQWIIGLALAALTAVPAMAQQPAAEPTKAKPDAEKVRVELRAPPKNTIAQVESAKPSEYWLGVECYSAVPSLLAQLNLPKGQGLVVASVAKNSPASKAGLARYDILLRAGGKPLASPEDFVAVIQAAKDGKLKIELIRGGKPIVIEVIPGKRPPDADILIDQRANAADRETVQKWLESINPGKNDGKSPAMQFRVFGPGAILRGHDANTPPLPNNLSIAISRQGDQPAKITVKRNGETWELTEKDLDKLPADVRPHVERMLHGGPFRVEGLKAIEVTPRGGTFQIPVPPPGSFHVQPFPGGIDPMLEKRFDEMNRRMDKIFQMMEEMSGQRPSPKIEEKQEQK